MTRNSPGHVIALIGPDAAGKTTLAAGLADALKPLGAVEVVHLGSPPTTAATQLARLALRIWRRLAPRGPGATGGHLFPRAISLLDAIERRALARECHARAGRGTTVVTDRYPGREPGSASGPRLTGTGSWFHRWCVRTELGIYQSIPAPHLVVRVLAPVADTVKRNAARAEPKPEHVIRASHTAAALVRFDGVREVVIENVRSPLEATGDLLRQIKHLGPLP